MTAFRYEMGKVEDKAESQKRGRPFYKPAIFCRFVKRGGDIVLPVNKAFEETHLTVRNQGDEIHVREVRILREALEDFKKNGSSEVSGTAIKEWPLVNAAEAENLRVVGIESVEQLAEVPDTELKDMGISKTLRQKAREYLEHAANAGASANKAAALAEENANLKAENADLKKEIALLAEQVKKLTPAGVENPKGK